MMLVLVTFLSHSQGSHEMLLSIYHVASCVPGDLESDDRDTLPALMTSVVLKVV